MVSIDGLYFVQHCYIALPITRSWSASLKSYLKKFKIYKWKVYNLWTIQKSTSPFFPSAECLFKQIFVKMWHRVANPSEFQSNRMPSTRRRLIFILLPCSFPLSETINDENMRNMWNMYIKFAARKIKLQSIGIVETHWFLSTQLSLFQTKQHLIDYSI